jgi:hypothetical protein
MFIVKMKIDNEAFGDRPEYEIARILRALADKVENTGRLDWGLMDYNGNTVGAAHNYERPETGYQYGEGM